MARRLWAVTWLRPQPAGRARLRAKGVRVGRGPAWFRTKVSSLIAKAPARMTEGQTTTTDPRAISWPRHPTMPGNGGLQSLTCAALMASFEVEVVLPPGPSVIGSGLATLAKEVFAALPAGGAERLELERWQFAKTPIAHPHLVAVVNPDQHLACGASWGGDKSSPRAMYKQVQDGEDERAHRG